MPMYVSIAWQSPRCLTEQSLLRPTFSASSLRLWGPSYRLIHLSNGTVEPTRSETQPICREKECTVPHEHTQGLAWAQGTSLRVEGDSDSCHGMETGYFPGVDEFLAIGFFGFSAGYVT